MKKTVHFETMESINFRLAQLEQKSKILSTKWPKRKGKLPEESAKKFENTMHKIGQSLQKGCRQIEPCAQQSRTLSGVFATASNVVVKKNAIRETYKPVTDFFNRLGEALKTIYEKVLKHILELPIVKEILEFISALVDTLIKKIMEFTQLDKLATWIGDKMNPFTALQDIEQQMEHVFTDCLKALEDPFHKLAMEKVRELEDQLTIVESDLRELENLLE